MFGISFALRSRIRSRVLPISAGQPGEGANAGLPVGEVAAELHLVGRGMVEGRVDDPTEEGVQPARGSQPPYRFREQGWVGVEAHTDEGVPRLQDPVHPVDEPLRHRSR